jgi:hypothetical protein
MSSSSSSLLFLLAVVVVAMLFRCCLGPSSRLSLAIVPSAPVPKISSNFRYQQEKHVQKRLGSLGRFPNFF